MIRALWAEGRLPHLRALFEEGTGAALKSGYGSKSAVVWSSMATGVTPDRHGIIDFVVPTPRGDVPVSSAVRRVPALWNMVSAAGGRVAVLAWWATWPAETVNGVVVSDRAQLKLRDRVSPAGWQPEFERLAAEAQRDAIRFPPNATQARDDLVARLAVELAGRDYDLLMAYFKSVDEIGHHYWKHYRPERYGPLDPDELARYGDYVPRAYEAVDQTLGEARAAAGPGVNVLVLSDHGFYGLKREKLRLSVDLDRVFERLGLLTRNQRGGVDYARTLVYTYASPLQVARKRVRFALAGREPGGRVEPAARPAARRRVEAALATVRYQGGAPAFEVLDAPAGSATGGAANGGAANGGAAPASDPTAADLVVRVLTAGAAETLTVAGEPLEGVVRILHRISGSHGASTDGIFLAAGPDVDPAAAVERVDLHDVAPTVLYALGLPVAEDFAGRAVTELFTAEFRRRFPLRTIPSWGSVTPGEAPTSEADEQLVEQLRALGYLD